MPASGGLTEPGSPAPVRPVAAERLATASFLALAAYLLVVFGPAPRVGGIVFTTPRVLLLLLIGGLALRSAVRVAAARGLVSPGRLLDLSFLSLALLGSLLAVDVAVSVYLNRTAPAVELESAAQTDSHAMVGEWYPPLYFPTEKNFRIHKPGFAISGSHYGGFYLPAMLDSPTLVDSVLDRRHVSIRINELGFRESGALDACPIFALGDSFTFGWGVTEGATWPDLLEQSLGTCVYNLGINDASPKQELMLLEHLLAQPRRPPVQRVLWVLYEGNDLEDSYADARPALTRAAGPARMLQGTVFGAIPVFVEGVRTQSLIHHLRTGRLRLRTSSAEREAAAHYTIDGVTLVTPLFHSGQLGYMLLDASLLDRGARSERYVRTHRHRRQLDRTFARMRRLSDSLHFQVTVVIVPTSARLYAPAFHPTPAPSAEPYFVQYLGERARASGFDVVDLLQELAPYARTELLYFRDDDHLNPRGHDVVARILASRLQAPEPGSP